MLEKFEEDSPSSSQNREENDRDELDLTLEVVDILDEINILQLLLETQTSVLNSLYRVFFRLKPAPKRPETQKDANAKFFFSTALVDSLQIETSQTDRSHFDFNKTHIRSMIVSSRDHKMEGILDAVGGKAGEFMEDTTQRLRMTKSGLGRIHDDASKTQRMVS